MCGSDKNLPSYRPRKHALVWVNATSHCKFDLYQPGDSAKPKEPQWTMRTRAVDPRRLIIPSSAASTTGQRLIATTIDPDKKPPYLG